MITQQAQWKIQDLATTQEQRAERPHPLQVARIPPKSKIQDSDQLLIIADIFLSFSFMDFYDSNS